MSHSTHPNEFWMARALQLAERGLWTTDPNPRVGCVLVKQGQVVGEGWHQVAGQGHAEVEALRAAGAAAAGADAYVTLEPCAHHGRTPPCSQALIKAGVARVIVATLDPNPLVAGQGVAQLREAGIEVVTDVLSIQAEQLNPGFLKRMRCGLPYVRSKLAMSLDGRTAMQSGESQWITSPAARRDVQGLRARSSAILTGVGTVLADNPSLTVRADELPQSWPIAGEIRQPWRVIVDSQLRTPPDARLITQAGKTLIATAHPGESRQAALRTMGAEVLYLPDAQQAQVDLLALLKVLAERGCNEVHVEAGAVLNGALLQAGLIDEMVIYMAALLMGDQARGLFVLPFSQMSEVLRLHISDIRAVGADWRITAKPQPQQI